MNAQFVDGISGLLLMPSADIDETGTFKITNNFLNHHFLPQYSYYEWDKENAFSYGFSIIFWSRLEVAYICTMMDCICHDRGNIHMINQDRHFVAKVLALKEGEIWPWTPSIAVGISDPVTYSPNHDYLDDNIGATGNGFFNRAYIVSKKHFNTSWGIVSAHIGYQYTRRIDFSATGPLAAIAWQTVWIQNRWFSPKFILEYDAKNLNIGFISSIWDDRFEAMFCLQGFKWVNFGLRFKLRLKGSE